MNLRPLGHLRTPFPTKYGVPRQPALVPAAWGRLSLSPELAGAASGLDACSHVWVIFGFHLVPEGAGRNKVRPPRLGGNARIGVLATRSPFRPNPLGLSVCRLEGVQTEVGGGVCVHLSGVDLVDGTPVYDLKPYLPYADVVADATVDWVPGAPERVPVRWDRAPSEVVSRRPALRALVEQVLAQDPRPPTHKAAHRADGLDRVRRYGTRLEDVDVRWEYVDGAIVVREVVPAGEEVAESGH